MLTGERRKDNESQNVAGLIPLIDKKGIIPVTSTMTRTEVLDCNLTPQQAEVLKRLLRPPKIQVKDATAPIMDLAHDIRDYYQQLRKDGKSNLPTVETPDAIHLATAIHFECDVFYTFDENDAPNGTRPKRALIPLSGTIAGRYPLRVCKPEVDSLGLPYG